VSPLGEGVSQPSKSSVDGGVVAGTGGIEGVAEAGVAVAIDEAGDLCKSGVEFVAPEFFVGLDFSDPLCLYVVNHRLNGGVLLSEEFVAVVEEFLALLRGEF